MSIVKIETTSAALFFGELNLLGLYPDFERLNLLIDEASQRSDLIKKSQEEACREADKYPEAFKPRKI